MSNGHPIGVRTRLSTLKGSRLQFQIVYRAMWSTVPDLHWCKLVCNQLRCFSANDTCGAPRRGWTFVSLLKRQVHNRSAIDTCGGNYGNRTHRTLLARWSRQPWNMNPHIGTSAKIWTLTLPLRTRLYFRYTTLVRSFTMTISANDFTFSNLIHNFLNRETPASHQSYVVFFITKVVELHNIVGIFYTTIGARLRFRLTDDCRKVSLSLLCFVKVILLIIFIMLPNISSSIFFAIFALYTHVLMITLFRTFGAIWANRTLDSYLEGRQYTIYLISLVGLSERVELSSADYKTAIIIHYTNPAYGDTWRIRTLTWLLRRQPHYPVMLKCHMVAGEGIEPSYMAYETS